MGTYKNLKKGTRAGLITCFVLIVIGVIYSVISLAIYIRDGMTVVSWYVRGGINLAIYFLLLYYAVAGYKKPHGNLLKFLFIALSVSNLLNVAIPTTFGGKLATFANICYSLSALIVAYVAGRLNKIAENKNFLYIAGVIYLAGTILINAAAGFSVIGMLAGCTPLIVLAALGFAYVARYEEHKIAGLEDKSDAGAN